MKLFDNLVSADIVLKNGAAEAVRLAAQDLQRDLRRISGKVEGFDISERSLGKSAIFIDTVVGGESEFYTVCVDDNSVRITGSDALGTVFGIYAFSTKCLGVLPMYRWVDIFPESRESMELLPQTFSSAKRPVRFRGWFINDEDLLTDFRGGAGKRYIDYKFYDKVIRTDVIDMVLETALRMEINLIIPSSFVDIDNPPERDLVEAVVRRGMYITHHHTEPVGVSFFTAENYLKKRGLEGEAVSFVTNRERMEEIWRYYVEKWAVYGEHVVWQLGLRGKADRAVWQHDPSVPDSASVRGAIISDAIATQHRIIAEALGRDDFYSTATLWMEGAELYGKGYLTVPKNTVIIFSDIGFSQMFGDDFFVTKRNEKDLYGIYYHVGYMQEGPHLVEGCDLHKMTFSYRQAYNQGSLFYSILNVSNLRPLHFSAWFNSKLLSSPATLDTDVAMNEMLRDIYGDNGAQVKLLTDEYYSSIADMGAQELKKRCTKWNFYYHEYGKLPFPLFPATDGALRYTGRYVMLGNEDGWDNDECYIGELRQSVQKWEALYAKLERFEERLTDDSRLYFDKFLKFETLYMMQLTRWRIAVGDMMRSESADERQDSFDKATGSLESILTERKILETGDWSTWHDGERKIGIVDLLLLTKSVYQKNIKKS